MRMAVLVMALGSCIACDHRAQEAAEFPARVAGPIQPTPWEGCFVFDENSLPCTVSLHAVIAAPEKFDQRHLSIKGFVAEGRHFALFTDRASAEHSIRENGMRLRLSDDEAAKLRSRLALDAYPRLAGKFTRVDNAHQALDGSGVGFVGELSNVRVVPVLDDAWSCATFNDESRYERSTPCPSVGAQAELDAAKKGD